MAQEICDGWRADLKHRLRAEADIDEFVSDHRPHGKLTGDATEPAWNGYLLTVVSPCGVVW